MDMNDKVAQYSFVILFGSVFPLSPLIAAVMEIITRTLDIKRYLDYSGVNFARAILFFTTL